MTEELPAWASDIIRTVPQRGEGLNRWLIRAAIALRRCNRDDWEIDQELRILTADQPVKHGEIERAVSRSAQLIDACKPTTNPPAKWPSIDKTLRSKIIAENSDAAAELWERSPYRLVDDAPMTETIVDTLFPGNPLICVAPTNYDARTDYRDTFRSTLAEMQFVVPSAMKAQTGKNQEGEDSPRCLDNTGHRQYLIVEQDSGTTDEQAAVIMHLGERAPLTMVVSSGGKSLHAWFACGSQPNETIRRFFAYAVSLGADPATWTPCQLVRMPDGLRRKDQGPGVRQSVFYFDREAAI